jgi:LPLT family lysophospholipid transporter-like MFS transporter
LVARNDRDLGCPVSLCFGDNALLFAALALVRKDSYPTWSGPLLQAFFVGAYILLAPIVGVFADARPKGRVMLYANIVKFGGALSMSLHVNPFVSYALIGAGAAANSPAKYGILGELAKPEQLVKANSLLEASTIAAILLGAVAGGALTDWSIEGALMAITGCYAASALSAIIIPRIKRAVPTINYSIVRASKPLPCRPARCWGARTRDWRSSAQPSFGVLGRLFASSSSPGCRLR